MPRGYSLSIHARLYFSREKGNDTFEQGTTIFFSHYNFFLGKLKEKLARKACVNTGRGGQG